MHAVHRFFLAALALTASLAIGSAARGQGTGSELPDPIRLTQLGVWLTACIEPSLSAEQLRAVVAAHDAYLDSIKPFREREVTPSIVEYERGMDERWKDAAANTAFRKRMLAIADRLGALDEVLFARIAESLSDEQRAGFATIRNTRTLQRLGGTLGTGTFTNEEFSIAELARELRQLTPQERSDIRPLLRDYESRALSLVHQWMDASGRFEARMIEATAPLRAGGPVSTQEWDAVRATVEQELGDWRQPYRKLRDACKRLHRDLAARISFTAQRELASLLRRHPNHAFNLENLGLEQRFRAALKATNDAEVKNRILDVYRRWAHDDDAFVDAAMERRMDPATARTFDQNETAARRLNLGAPFMNELAKLVDGAAAKRVTEGAAFTDAFGPDELDEVEVPRDYGLLRYVASQGLLSGQDDNTRWTRGRGVPKAIDAAIALAWLGEVTPEERATVETIVGDARDRWQAEIVPAFSALDRKTSEARMSMSALAGDAGAGPTLDDEFALADEAAALKTRCAVLDATALDAFAAALGPERATGLALARRERELELWADHESADGGGGGYEFMPNLARVVRLSMPARLRDRAERSLLQDGEALVAIARARSTARIRGEAEFTWVMYRAGALQQAWTTAHPNEPMRHELSAQIQELYARQAQLAATTDRLVQESAASMRAALDRMLGTLAQPPSDLSDAERLAIQVAYEREAYPERFRDLRAVTTYFARAEALKSLDDARRAAVVAERQSSGMRLNRWYLAILDEFRTKPLPADQIMSRVANVREGRFHFERGELNARAIWALRALLTPEERASIRSLDQYDWLCVRAGNYWWLE